MSASKPSSEFRGRDELLNEEEEELIVTHERKEDEEEESDDDRETMKWCQLFSQKESNLQSEEPFLRKN